MCIIDENNIWAVGEIYLKDSTGQFDPLRYNLTTWNGLNWSLGRIQFPQYNSDCSIADSSPGAIHAAYRIDDSAILVTDGLSVARIEGSEVIHYPCVSLFLIGAGRFRGIWGRSESDFYCVGTNGTVFHFTGSTWEKLESGTTTDINDIWGGVRGGKNVVLAVASDRYQTGDYKLLSIAGTQVVDTLSWVLNRRLNSIWFGDAAPIYECGSGVRVYKDGIWEEIPLSNYFTTRIRGTGANNIVVVGGFGFIAHYNGSSWKEYPELFFSQGSLEDLAVKGNTVVAVGYTGAKALVLRGRHQ